MRPLRLPYAEHSKPGRSEQPSPHSCDMPFTATPAPTCALWGGELGGTGLPGRHATIPPWWPCGGSRLGTLGYRREMASGRTERPEILPDRIIGRDSPPGPADAGRFSARGGIRPRHPKPPWGKRARCLGAVSDWGPAALSGRHRPARAAAEPWLTGRRASV